MDEIGFSDFHIDEIIEYIKNSTWTDIVKSNKQLSDSDSIIKLVSSILTGLYFSILFSKIK